MEAITITLDDIEVSGYPGMSILDLARESGVAIPTLCNEPHLSSIGACRICLVEEDKTKALLASCVTPIREGMVINTRSPRVMERRKLILEFMLASHPDSCLICDKGNRCELRTLASEMGIGNLELRRIPQPASIIDVNPFLERDLSKCIVCAKCIRADQELVVQGAIDYAERGFISRPATFDYAPLECSECTFCGTCVAFCPTGALSEKKKPYHGTTSTTVDSVCPYCGCGCSIRLEVKNNRLVRVKPLSDGPVNQGALCARGSYGLDFSNSPDRLKTALVRTDGEMREAAFDEAVTVIAGELARIKDSYGPDSIAVLGSSRCTNEDNYLLQKFTRCVLETNNIDNGSRLYNTASREGLGWSIGFPCTTATIDELEQSEVIMVAGADISASAPAVSYAVKRAVRSGNAGLLLVDPRRTKLTPFAEIWLKLEIGSDAALINGMAKIIVDEKLYDEEFVTRRTDKFEEYAESLKTFTPEYAEKITGVSSDDIRAAARMFAGASRASIVYGTGITQQPAGTNIVIALANLAMLTGNTGHHGGGIFAVQRENNAQGACDMGNLPDFLPGYRSVDDSQAAEEFGREWKKEIPVAPGLTALEMFEQAESGKVKAMVIMGENPVSVFPDSSYVARVLQSLEFLAVVDIFPTETTDLAAVVLPAAAFSEKDGTFTNFEGRVQQLRKAVEPPGDCRADWDIVMSISNAMGYPMEYSSARQIMSEIEGLVPLYQKHSRSEFEQDEDEPDDNQADKFGAKRFYKGPFPSGFGRFTPVEYSPPVSVGDTPYPLTLIAGSTLYRFGGGTRTSQSSRLKVFKPRPWIEISESDVKRYGFTDGEPVRVISPAGEISADIKVSDSLSPGTVFMPSSFKESPVNTLFEYDTKKSLKNCAVRLERIEDNGKS